MSRTALITGSSTGIGFELSMIFAQNGYNLVLVSRNQERLLETAENLENQYRIKAKVISKDLSTISAAQELYDELTSDDINIDVLVNNAGFAINGNFVDFSPERHMELIQLNITSLTLLCNLFGRDMIKRRSGRILNVASTAAFQAGPLMSTYYASKAYVLLLSEGLYNEFSRDGVKVSVLCPGPTETQFAVRADMSSSKVMKLPWVMDAAKVAEIAFSGFMKGKKVIVPGLMNKILVFSTRLTPRSVLVLITRYLNQK